MKNIKQLTLSICCLISTLNAQNTTCYGEKRDLAIGNTMPYTKVKVGTAEGLFLIDFGTTGSSIDPNGFISGKPVANASGKFDDFDFYGSWGSVNLSIQNQSNIKLPDGMKQAGIIGTDFLCFNIFTIDYPSKTMWRSTAKDFCSDSRLMTEGFKAASSAGYFSNDLSKLNNSCTPNVPTVPVQIGKATAVAQIDPGFDDNQHRHSVNINQAFYNAIVESGIKLIEDNTLNLTLSTCISGVSESVKGYKLPSGVSFSIIGVDGNPIVIHSDACIFLKQTPASAKSCGGIGTWQIPAAQIGASFLMDSKKVIFDPFKSKVWFYTK